MNKQRVENITLFKNLQTNMSQSTRYDYTNYLILVITTIST